MLSLITSLLVVMVSAEHYKLAAVARLGNTQNSFKCIESDGNTQYWVNMDEMSINGVGIVATGGITTNALTVNGPVVLGSTSADIITIQGNLSVTGNATFEKQLTVKIYDGTTESLKLEVLSKIILQLESIIAKLCTPPSVC